MNKTQPKLSTTTQEIIYLEIPQTQQIPLQQQQIFILGQWGLLGRPHYEINSPITDYTLEKRVVCYN